MTHDSSSTTLQAEIIYMISVTRLASLAVARFACCCVKLCLDDTVCAYPHSIYYMYVHMKPEKRLATCTGTCILTIILEYLAIIANDIRLLLCGYNLPAF